MSYSIRRAYPACAILLCASMLGCGYARHHRNIIKDGGDNPKDRVIRKFHRPENILLPHTQKIHGGWIVLEKGEMLRMWIEENGVEVRCVELSPDTTSPVSFAYRATPIWREAGAGTSHVNDYIIEIGVSAIEIDTNHHGSEIIGSFQSIDQPIGFDHFKAQSIYETISRDHAILRHNEKITVFEAFNYAKTAHYRVVMQLLPSAGEADSAPRAFPFRNHAIMRETPRDGTDREIYNLVFPAIGQKLNLNEMASAISAAAFGGLNDRFSNKQTVSILYDSIRVIHVLENAVWLEFSAPQGGSGRFQTTYHFLLHWDGTALHTLFEDEIDRNTGAISISSPPNGPLFVMRRTLRAEALGKPPAVPPDRSGITSVFAAEIWTCAIRDARLHWLDGKAYLFTNLARWPFDELIEFVRHLDSSRDPVLSILNLEAEAIMDANPGVDFSGMVEGPITAPSLNTPHSYIAISNDLSAPLHLAPKY